VINEFTILTRCKINIQKFIAFLYTNNEAGRDIKKIIPSTIAPKIRYLGIKLTEEVKYLYSENYKTLMKEIGDDTKKWKDIPCSQIGRILLKCLYYSQQSIHLMQFLSKYQQHFSHNWNK